MRAGSSLPELPASVRPPGHARSQPGQATGQSRSTALGPSVGPCHVRAMSGGEEGGVRGNVGERSGD
ncbi:hypothetical protein DEH69_16090 [Streptomyces sp. PT12]|nr:hypothetical protein DEH69_16090 [Streptomyces sp. PT12]